MAKHRAFNVDRFTDKFRGQEQLLRAYVASWKSGLAVDPEKLDVPTFKEFLLKGDGPSKDDFLEGLYRCQDLSNERGHEDLLAAAGALGYPADPEGKLPVECLALKIRTESEEAFDLAYDRNRFFNAERFTVFSGTEPRAIENLDAARDAFRAKLQEAFKGDKNSDRVLVRSYQEGDFANFVVYHERRTKAELVFKGSAARPTVSPTILRPAQQDFLSYNPRTGVIEIEAHIEKEANTLRKLFAECCLDDEQFFEGPNAAKRIDLAPVAAPDFEMPVNRDAGHSATIVEMHLRLAQVNKPTFVIRSDDVLATLTVNGLRARLTKESVRRVVFKFTFPDDRRGKRVEIAGTNSIKFKKATHADEVRAYLKSWNVLLD